MTYMDSKIPEHGLPARTKNAMTKVANPPQVRKNKSVSTLLYDLAGIEAVEHVAVLSNN